MRIKHYYVFVRYNNSLKRLKDTEIWNIGPYRKKKTLKINSYIVQPKEKQRKTGRQSRFYDKKTNLSPPSTPSVAEREPPPEKFVTAVWSWKQALKNQRELVVSLTEANMQGKRRWRSSKQTYRQRSKERDHLRQTCHVHFPKKTLLSIDLSSPYYKPLKI